MHLALLALRWLTLYRMLNLLGLILKVKKYISQIITISAFWLLFTAYPHIWVKSLIFSSSKNKVHIWKSKSFTIICDGVDFVSSASWTVQPTILLSDKDEMYLSDKGKVAFSDKVLLSG